MTKLCQNCQALYDRAKVREDEELMMAELQKERERTARQVRALEEQRLLQEAEDKKRVVEARVNLTAAERAASNVLALLEEGRMLQPTRDGMNQLQARCSWLWQASQNDGASERDSQRVHNAVTEAGERP